jgi:hypothetical protein
MAASLLAFRGRGLPPHPWGNHELAELYRIVDAFSHAGIVFETEMGLSDEGDPWFVLCHAGSDDVFVHLTRLNGKYIAVRSNYEAISDDNISNIVRGYAT